MTTEKQIAKLFNLSWDNWQKHANPWSVWTRFATLPFLVLATWSHIWISWYSLIPITILVIWLIINPTLFKKPKSFDSWASKAVLWEKFYAERKSNPVPTHHNIAIIILSVIQSIWGIVLIVGLWNTHVYFTILGTIIIYLGKMWFLDRMVWIYEDMMRK